MQVCPIGNRVTNVNADAEPDSSIWGLVAVMDWEVLLYLDGTAYRPVYAVEYDQQRVTTSLDNSAAMLLDRWVY
jgi:hypothetical protein